MIALHPAPQEHTQHMALYVDALHPTLQEPPQHMTIRVLSSQSAPHVLALHPALQGHTRYMALHVYIKYTNLLETISIRIECIWGKDSYIIGFF